MRGARKIDVVGPQAIKNIREVDDEMGSMNNRRIP